MKEVQFLACRADEAFDRGACMSVFERELIVPVLLNLRRYHSGVLLCPDGVSASIRMAGLPENRCIPSNQATADYS